MTRNRSLVRTALVASVLCCASTWAAAPTSLDETLTRNSVLAEAPRRSGGRMEQLGQASGISKRLAEIAYELHDQLAVTYTRPASAKPVERIDVAVKRRGLKLRAPKYVS